MPKLDSRVPVPLATRGFAIVQLCLAERSYSCGKIFAAACMQTAGTHSGTGNLI